MDDMLSDEWVPYYRERIDYGNQQPLVSIQKKGTINLNALAKSFLGDHVQLFFNPARMQLGLRPAKANTRGAYTVRKMKSTSQTYVVSGKGLFTSYGLDTEKIKGRYPVSPESGMLVVQLPTNGG